MTAAHTIPDASLPMDSGGGYGKFRRLPTEPAPPGEGSGALSDPDLAKAGPESATDRRPAVLPMTTGQLETLLRSDLDDASAAVFNECLVIRIPGTLDPMELDRSLARLSTRHPLLRGVPDAANAQWAIRDEAPRWEKLEASDEDAALRLLDTRASTALASTGCPPVAFLHIKQARGGTTLAFLAHHCILDGWTASVFLRELAHCYRVESGATEFSLPEPDDIGRFIRAENENEKVALANRDLRAFWEKRCANLPAMRWPGKQFSKDYAAGHVHIHLPAGMVGEVRAAARKAGRTEFTLWLGIHLLWLHWLYRQDDLITGIPLAGQAARGMPNLLGHGTRFLPVRSRRIPSVTAGEFLDALAIEVAEVIQHGELTAGAMTEWLDRETIRAGFSLLPTAFSVVPELEPADFGRGGESEAFILSRTHVSMPVVAWLQEKKRGLELDLAYHRASFDAGDMNVWSSVWLVIAATISCRPEVRIEQLPLPEAPASPTTTGETSVPSSFHRGWTPTARRVAEVWSEMLGKPIQSPGTDFFAVGGQSLLALRFFSRWNRESGVNAPLATLLNFPVLADLADELDRLGGAPVAETPSLPRGLACLRGSGDASPLLFLHAGDGGVIFSRDIARDLPARHPIFAIESPHLSGDSLPEKISVSEMAERYLEIWESCRLGMAPVLIGYSFGGVVAWEMAVAWLPKEPRPRSWFLLTRTIPNSRSARWGCRTASGNSGGRIDILTPAHASPPCSAGLSRARRTISAFARKSVVPPSSRMANSGMSASANCTSPPCSATRRPITRVRWLC